MRTIAITAGGCHYEALVGHELLEKSGQLIAAAGLRGPRCALIADKTTAALFADKVLASLRAAGFAPSLITFPPGEKAKSLPQLGAVCDEMTEVGLDRVSFVVALGGGVVGDLAGFAAAIYHRGIPCVQIPTTLLAQVDSAVGGKTGVNTAQGKNLLGAVRQPALIVADTALLETLPAREFNQGFAEIIKHAIIADASLLQEVEQVSNPPPDGFAVANLQANQIASWKLAPLIARNIEIKAAIVARDEQDRTGARAILNFGHTIGHAIERAAGYGTLLHGEAISLGLVAACEISVQKAGFPNADRDRVTAALRDHSLPTMLPPNIARAKILEAVSADKKFARGEVRFVLSPRLGSAYLAEDISMSDLEAAIGKL